MLKAVFRSALLLTAIALLTTCTSRSSGAISPITTVFESPLPSVTPTIFISPLPTQIALPPPTSTPVTTSTPLPEIPIATEWLTYAHKSGVSIQYPANWQVRSYPYDRVVFGIQPDGEVIPNYRMDLDIYNRSHKDRSITNPYTWQPNEGGYEVHWVKPISIDAANGLEFVWGGYYNHTWDTRPVLYAVYYSEEYELDIRLSTWIDDGSIKFFETNGFANTISSRFTVFEHMVESININR